MSFIFIANSEGVDIARGGAERGRTAGETDLSVDEMFESWLAGAGVDLVLRGGRELGSKGVVEGHRVVQVSQLAAVCLLLPLPYVYI